MPPALVSPTHGTQTWGWGAEGWGLRLEGVSFAAQKPRVSESDFEDLLSGQGFASKADRKGPRTMAEMRRQDLARASDPLKLKVGTAPGVPVQPLGLG